jgi:hypothetical protein
VRTGDFSRMLEQFTEDAARAGSMILRLRDAEIDRLLVTFG